MNKLNIGELPATENVCQQILREVQKQDDWSMAHVVMNPLDNSLAHVHRGMTEIYVVVRGYGELTLGPVEDHHDGITQQVTAGSVRLIQPGRPHMLKNTSAGSLEHLVLALPPFDPDDVCLLDRVIHTEATAPAQLPEPREAIDGVLVLPYAFDDIDLSIAFGWVSRNATKGKQPHYHKDATEFVYVVEGDGCLHLDGDRYNLEAGDWVRIDPETSHLLDNASAKDMVVVCICSPAFRMEDVYFN